MQYLLLLLEASTIPAYLFSLKFEAIYEQYANEQLVTRRALNICSFFFFIGGLKYMLGFWLFKSIICYVLGCE